MEHTIRKQMIKTKNRETQETQIDLAKKITPRGRFKAT